MRFQFFVPGEPMPQPSMGANPDTGRTFYRVNRKADYTWKDWRKIVAVYAKQAAQKGQMIKSPTPVALYMQFYRTKPKSVKLPYPSRRPDLSNYAYIVENTLTGILYEDDAQVVTSLYLKSWTDKLNANPGVMIVVQALPDHQNR